MTLYLAADPITDLANAKDTETMLRILVGLLAALVVFFFYKWQIEVAEAKAEDKQQIKTLLEARDNERPVRDWPSKEAPK